MKYLSFLFALVLFLALGVTTASAASYHGPRIKVKDGTSTNWSGYAAVDGSLSSPTTGAVSDVVGTWTVPSVDCSTATGNTYSSAWVGMDGYSNSTVEQLGTEHDCINGTPLYYVWYEMYPKPAYRVKLSVMPGDNITAEVKYISGKFQLSLTNLSLQKKNTFTTTQRMHKAQRQSVEWIVEAPWSGGVLPLANFGTLGFTNAHATIGNSVLGPLGNFLNDQLTMVDANGNIKASTSAITNGTDFTVSWVHE